MPAISVRHLVLGVSASLVLLSLSTSAAYSQCGSLSAPSNSAVSSGGDFNTPGTWGAGVVPNSTTNTCIINGTSGSPATVTLASLQTGNVLSLQVGANNTLTLSTDSGFVVNGPQIINNGSIGVNATGGFKTGLDINASTTLSGAGTLTLSTTAGSAAIIQELSSVSGSGPTGLTLTNSSTIAGGGVIGNGGLTLANSGTVNANASGQTLFLDGTGNGMVGVTNTGLLTATGGGTLELSTVVANNGANITANGGTVIVGNPFNNFVATINGGTLTSTGGGTFETLGGNTATLNGVTLAAGTTYINPADANLLVSGTITNNGDIRINANGGAASNLQITANTTLSGTGTVTLSYNNTLFNDASILGATAGLTLTNSSGSTIQGAGNIGSGGLTLANSGTVNANTSGLALITIGAITNTGLLEATSGGTLDLEAAVNNTGGNITANGGTVNVLTAVTGGTLNSLGGGTLGNIADSTSTLSGVTISAGTTFINSNDSGLLVSGTITNNGVILLNGAAGGGNSILDLTANTTLSGGTLTMTEITNSGFAAIIQGTVAGLTLTNTGAIQGAGVIGNDGNFTLANSGTVNANSSGQTLILNSNSLGGVTNTGTLEATNNGTLQISTVINNAGGNITANGGAVLSNSTIQGGTLNTTNGGTMGTNPASSSTLDGSTHGALTISAGSTYTNGNASVLFTLGTIANNGNIALNAAGNNSILDLTANTTLNGGGTVSLSTTGAGTAIVQQLSGGITLTNAGNTIQGAGIIGNGGLTVNNQAGGVIDANINTKTLTLNGSGGVSNAGLLEASAGGKLLVSATLTNFTSGTGALTGNYAVDGSSGNKSTLQIDTLGSAVGGGEIHVLGNGTTPSSITLNGTNANTLFTDLNGVSSALGLAAITANASLTVEGGYGLTTPGALSNAGSVTVGGSSSLLDVNGGYTQTAGSTVVAFGGTLTASAFTLSGGTAQVDGTVDPPIPGIIDPGTELFGTGDFVGNVISSGEIFPGDDPAPGTFTIDGNYEETGTGSFMEDIGGTQGSPMAGFLEVEGNVQLDSGATLDVGSLAFTPVFDQAFTVLSYTGTFSGSFQVTGLDASDFNVLYNSGNVELQWNQGGSALGTPEPASFWLSLAVLGLLLAWGGPMARRAERLRALGLRVSTGD